MNARVLLISLLISLLPQQQAYADLSATPLSWGLSHVTLDGVVFDMLKLDVEMGPRYVQVNGELVSSAQSLSKVQIPLNGSCIFTLNSKVACTLYAGLRLVELNLEGSGSGTYLVKSNTGAELGSGMAWLTLIQ